jgi:hypothetical protein
VPGRYTAAVHAGSAVQRVGVKVLPDPRYSVPADTYRADTEAGLAARAEMSAINRLLNHIAAMRAGLKGVLGRAGSDARWSKRHAALVSQAKSLNQALGGFERELWNPHTQHGAAEDFLRHFTRFHQHVQALYGMASGIWGEKPSAQMRSLLSADRARIERLLSEYDGALLDKVKAWNSAAYAAGVGTLPTGEEVTLRSPPPLPSAS